MRGRSLPFAAVPPTVTSRPDDAALSELETANRRDLDSTALCGRIADPSADFPQPTARETACGLPEPAQCRAIRYPLAGAIRRRGQQATDRTQQSGFAGAVGADDGDGFAFLDRQIDAEQRLEVAIE